MVTKVLKSLSCSEGEIEAIVKNSATVFDVGDGVKIARFCDVMCCKYNKPEALQLFIEQEKLQPKQILFVDDNLTNAFNVFSVRAALNDPECETHVYWYEPPEGGRAESVSDEQTVALAHKFMEHFEANSVADS